MKLSFMVLAMFVVNVNSSFANELTFGMGGTYGQQSLENTTSSTSSIYRGLGMTFDLRYRIHPDRLSTTLGIDFFAILDLDWHSNINPSVSESMSLTGYGGGLDIRLNWLFIGAQYRLVKTTFSTTNNSSTLNYGSIGLRGGLNIPIADQFEISAFGVFSNDAASARENNLTTAQPIQEIKGFLQIRYTLIRDWFD